MSARTPAKVKAKAKAVEVVHSENEQSSTSSSGCISRTAPAALAPLTVSVITGQCVTVCVLRLPGGHVLALL